MNLEQELIDLKKQYTSIVAKQAATEVMLGTLMAFVKANPLLAEVALQKAADQEAAAMQLDGSASEVLPAFLAEIDDWQTKLLSIGCMSGMEKASPQRIHRSVFPARTTTLQPMGFLACQAAC